MNVTTVEVPRGWVLYWGLDICSGALDYESQHMKFCLKKNEVMYLTSIVIDLRWLLTNINVIVLDKMAAALEAVENLFRDFPSRATFTTKHYDLKTSEAVRNSLH